MLSRYNPRIKYIRRLAIRRFRDREKRFVAEGVRFVEEALASSWPVEALVYCGKIGESRRGEELLKKADSMNIAVIEVDETLFDELAGTETPQGVLAVVRQGAAVLEDLAAAPAPALLVVVDGVQDPGNLGTIVRSADAAGAGGVILLKGTTDIYNPKACRATMGSIFHLPVLQGLTAAEVLPFLAGRSIATIAGDPRGAKPVAAADLTRPCALIVGSESGGINAALLDMVDDKVRIPMPGRAESLNVAVAVSIMLYEALRQRDIC
ncbi:TrmH family RNA methyltransferase [Pelotomaculum propionicicum]|uniref:23S rRNA (Uridine(2479)-2'-O)-methyltransferase n=1 Tax=Pelotomaculum propionicicum TaxID=258475 RepID=A0A4Y7RQP8_9FIRM|nr:RNA methyltransferase [Pelotomaculum propionicicum]TEB11070.1 23S rRNA (uridine(2479)-2'-O)-methyltransferase [Pelotomaculum propionicicum]